MRTDKHWPVPNPEILPTLTLPPRPGIKRICPKCGILHHSRTEVLECLAQPSHNA